MKNCFVRTPFHLVGMSPWPIIVPMAIFSMALGAIGRLHSGFWCWSPLIYSFVFVLVGGFMWWRDIIRESTKMGYHSYLVISGLRFGVIFFIASEVLFFFAFFWSFFHTSGDAMVDISDTWPPMGVRSISAFDVPFLNTMVLLSSGVTLTLSHSVLLNNKIKLAWVYMLITVILGLYFTFLQFGEYKESVFSFSDHSFGSIFYIATGFHGLHVIIGSIFLIVCFFRIYYLHLNGAHHTGFEAAAWYWHFVDVVWLFLFVSIYWWGA